jgi:HSP20 family molecular chaperone IbpA
MQAGDNREKQPEFNLDQALGAILKNVGAALDILAETIDAAGANLTQPSSRRRSHAGAHDLPIDIFDEGRELLVVVELPGAQPDDIRVSAQDDILEVELAGEPGTARELLLPTLVDPASLQWTYRTGILEIRLEKVGVDDPT